MPLDTFVCPLSKGALSLVSFEEERIKLTPEQLARAKRLEIAPEKLSRVVKTGVLYCPLSRKWYPIINYVPLLLDYATEIHRDFINQHASRTSIFSEYEMPNGVPRPGEEVVQKSFTKEWATLNVEKNISFGLTPEQRDSFIGFELDWPVGFLNRGKLKILEVGCGSGFESLSL